MSKTISEKIQELRKEKGITQEQLGEILGVSGQAVSKWEKGESLPDILALPTLCKTLGVSTDYLLDTSIEMKEVNLYRSFSTFAETAGENKALFKAFTAVSNKPAPNGSICEGLQWIIDDNYLKIYDPRGMGFIIENNNYANLLFSLNVDEAISYFTLLSDRKVLTVIKSLNYSEINYLDKIVELSNLTNDEVYNIICQLQLKRYIVSVIDNNGNVGYVFDERINSLMLGLSGAFLESRKGHNENVKGTSFLINRHR